MSKVRYLPLLLLVAVLGCGSGNPKTIKTTGVVTYNGKPVEGAMVSFGSTEGKRSAGGQTDANGRFTLTTFAQDDGAVPGQYTVAVSKSEITGGMTEDEEHAAVQAQKPVSQPKSVDKLPAKYKSGNTSGLKAAVTEGGENHFEFDLKDKA